MNFVKTKPELAGQVAKSDFVARPVAKEINQAIESLLKDNPATTFSALIAEDIKLVFAIRVDCVDSAFCLSRLQQLVAICKYFPNK